MSEFQVETPVTGKVWEVLKNNGDSVAANETVLVVESMKMEIPVEAPVGGTIHGIEVAAGDEINEGEVVAVIAS